jgi:hypothetical protein
LPESVVSFISAREARARRVCSSSSTFVSARWEEFRDRHFPDVTSSPRRPIIVADFRAKKESVFAQSDRDGRAAEVRGRAHGARR